MKTQLKIAMVIGAAAFATALPATAEEWNWSLTPYIWATDVGVNVAISDKVLVDETIPFDDLLDDLDAAFMVRAEGWHGNFGFAIDLFSVGLADDDQRFPLPGGNGDEIVLDTKTDMTILDIVGLYAPRGDGDGFALRYGTRVINQRNELQAQLPARGAVSASYDSDETLVDALLGFRFARKLGQRWSYELAADVSTGDTDLTWSLGPSFGYTFGRGNRYELDVGYRHMVVDFDDATPVDSQMSMSGVLLGLSFDF